MNDADRIFSKIQKEMDFISMVALNRTVAQLAIFRLPNLVQEVFDRPTPYIMKGFRYKKAERGNLTASVFADDFVGPSPHKTLAAQIFGGSRKPKRFEVALRAKGVLPKDQFVVPGKDAKIDSYGNMSGAQLVQVLSAFSAFTESGFLANKSKRKGARVNRNTSNMFVINTVGRKDMYSMGGTLSDLYQDHSSISNRLQGLPMGIYQRVGRHGIKQLMKFIKQPSYERRFNFFEDGQRLGQQILSYEFDKAFKEFNKD